MHADMIFAQLHFNGLRILRELFAEWQNARLHWSEPGWECARVMLDQDSEESLHGSKQSAVHHQRLMTSAVFAHVFQSEPRGQIEIELNGCELPRPSNRVDQLHVNFRAVECRFALNSLEWNVHAVERVAERRGGAVPVLRFARIIFRMRGVPFGKLHFVAVESKSLHHCERKIQTALHFEFDLIGTAKNMRVILCKAAHAQQSVQHAGALV